MPVPLRVLARPVLRVEMEAASAVTPMKISEVSGGCRYCSGSGHVAPGRTLDLRHITSNDIKSTLRIYTSLYIRRNAKPKERKQCRREELLQDLEIFPAGILSRNEVKAAMIPALEWWG